MRRCGDRLGELAMPVGIVTGRRDEKYETIGRQMLERISATSRTCPFDCGRPVRSSSPLSAATSAAFAAQHG